MIKYLNANPNASVDVIGYADELGDFNYNINLSKRRAERVMEMIVRSGIDAKRFEISSERRKIIQFLKNLNWQDS